MSPVSRLSKLSALWVVMAMAVLPRLTDALSRAPKHPDGVALETIPLQLDSNSLVPGHIHRDLSNHSVSPWTYNTSLDMDRIPHLLFEAHCSLRGCLDAEGMEDLNLESKPILNQMLVLRRVLGPGGRGPQYRLESHMLSVGCTCVRPSVLQQDH